MMTFLGHVKVLTKSIYLYLLIYAPEKYLNQLGESNHLEILF